MQKSASIQPRTSFSKFEGDSFNLFNLSIRLLTQVPLLKWAAEGYACKGVGGLLPGTNEVCYPNSSGAANLRMPTLNITAASFPPFVATIANIVQMVGLLTFSAFGDYGARRKQLMKLTMYVACGFVALHVFATDSSYAWWLLAIVRVGAGVCFTVNCVYYNAYMPLLAANHYEVVPLEGEARSTKEAQVTDEMSSKGNGFGYLGGLTMQVLALVVLLKFECKTPPAGEIITPEKLHSDFELFFVPCLCVASVALWWGGFGTYAVSRFHPRPGPAFPPGNVMLLGWKTTGATLLEMCKYKQMLRFMIGYLFWSDAQNTVLNLSILIFSSPAADSTDLALESGEELALDASPTNVPGPPISSLLAGAIAGPLLGMVGVSIA